MRPRCQNASSIILIAVVCALPFLFRSLPVRAQSPGATSLGPIAAAQPLSFDRGAAALWQSLQKLHTRASLMMVTAHPARTGKPRHPADTEPRRRWRQRDVL